MVKIAVSELLAYFLEIVGVGFSFDNVEELYRAALLKTKITKDCFFGTYDSFEGSYLSKKSVLFLSLSGV